MERLIVTEIWIYPVKSLGGLSLPAGRVLSKGITHDRRWMLIDENNQFMTQRVYPGMALFKLSPAQEGFLVNFGEEQIHLPFEHTGIATTARIWDDEVNVYEVSKRHSEWFSHHLGMACRLVFFPENEPRAVDPDYAFGREQVSLADAYPLLMIGQESLNDLNSRMRIPLPMNRFRPNIVFKGGMPYAEDNWKNLAIGQTRLSAVKPCSRCVLTTVDQDTGRKGIEPLVTLATYRKKGNKINFGQNLLVKQEGLVTVGEEISLEPENFID